MKVIKEIKSRAAITLIEMITTLFIMSLLMLLILPNINHIRSFAEHKQAVAFQQSIKNQVALFKAQYPQSEVTVVNMTEKGFLSADQAAQVVKSKINLKME